MTDPAIAEAQQRLELGAYVELFTVDITSLGGGVLYWTPSRPSDDKPVIWQGNTYASVDVEVTGFEKSTSGPLARPQLSIGNADNLVGSLLAQYADALGCVVTRTRTLYEFLDDQPGADPDALWPLDIFLIERKVSQNKNKIVLELAAATDQSGTQLPRRIILRDICTLIYRRWNGAAFDYANATCPYAGDACYNALASPSSPAGDRCGKRVSDCKKRFGPQAQLPYGGFPGVAKVRTA